MRRVTLLLVTLLTGCSPTYWYIPPQEKTEQQIKRDTYECRRDSIAATQSVIGSLVFSSRVGGATERVELMNQCMEVRGYRVTDDPCQAEAAGLKVDLDYPPLECDK